MNKDSIIDYITRKINIAYRVNQKCCISFVVSDDIELKKQIQKQISSINTNTILDERIVNYDFFKNRNNGLTEYSRLCKEKGNLLLVTGLERYAEYLKQTGQITNVGDFYMNAFNMPRDSFYLQNNVRIILLLNQQEYDMFLSEYGDDFLSYAHIQEDIDSMLENKMNNHENFCKKLGNEFYTRLDYTDEDREVREALKQGIEDYKNTADERASQSKEMRATAFAQQSSDLKKLRKTHKKAIQNRGDSWTR